MLGDRRRRAAARVVERVEARHLRVAQRDVEDADALGDALGLRRLRDDDDVVLLFILFLSLFTVLMVVSSSSCIFKRFNNVIESNTNILFICNNDAASTCLMPKNPVNISFNFCCIVVCGGFIFINLSPSFVNVDCINLLE